MYRRESIFYFFLYFPNSLAVAYRPYANELFHAERKPPARCSVSLNHTHDPVWQCLYNGFFFSFRFLFHCFFFLLFLFLRRTFVCECRCCKFIHVPGAKPFSPMCIRAQGNPEEKAHTHHNINTGYILFFGIFFSSLLPDEVMTPPPTIGL